MNIIIEGVNIELTFEQISKIEAARKERALSKKSFVSILKHFGFKKLDTSNWTDKTIIAFEHAQNNWYAEITNNNVWMVGKGLKDSGFPGGSYYFTINEVETALLQVLDNISQP